MLKKILEVMYIEPELLAELDEEQKQLLFFKMREEQVRRWKLREDEIGDKDVKFTIKFSKHPRKQKGSLKVSFVTRPNSDDPLIIDIDSVMASKRNSQETKENPDSHKNDSKEPSSRPTPNIKPQHLIGKKVGNSTIYSPQSSFEMVDSPVGKSENRTESEQASDEGGNIERNWKDQEELIKQHDKKQKILLQKVRELRKFESAVDLSLDVTPVQQTTQRESRSPLSAPVSSASYFDVSSDPQTKANKRMATIKWFKDVEAPRGAGKVPTTGQIADWFHGIISREEAESLLSDKPVGSFLIRVSDKILGYTVSYKSMEKCKHFLVDATPSGERGGIYRFFGAHAIAHDSLSAFVQHYRKTPISMSGCELLIKPCEQANPSQPDYAELYECGTDFL